MGGGGTEAAGTQADDGRTALVGGGGTEAAGTEADDGRTALVGGGGTEAAGTEADMFYGTGIRMVRQALLVQRVAPLAVAVRREGRHTGKEPLAIALPALSPNPDS